MKLEELRGVPLPFPVKVEGWRWPVAQGDALSKAVFSVCESEAGRLQPTCLGPCSVGVFRTAEPGIAWYVWIVDVGVQLRRRSKMLRAVSAEKAEPPERVAERLVLRHLRTIHDEWVAAGRPTSAEGLQQRAHYGLGAMVDEHGIAHVLAGRDG